MFYVGVLHWIENLKWRNINRWKNCDRKPLVVNGIIEGYEKSSGNFAFYWVNRAGHMVLYKHIIISLTTVIISCNNSMRMVFK